MEYSTPEISITKFKSDEVLVASTNDLPQEEF